MHVKTRHGQCPRWKGWSSTWGFSWTSARHRLVLASRRKIPHCALSECGPGRVSRQRRHRSRGLARRHSPLRPEPRSAASALGLLPCLLPQRAARRPMRPRAVPKRAESRCVAGPVLVQVQQLAATSTSSATRYACLNFDANSMSGCAREKAAQFGQIRPAARALLQAGAASVK